MRIGRAIIFALAMVTVRRYCRQAGQLCKRLGWDKLRSTDRATGSCKTGRGSWWCEKVSKAVPTIGTLAETFRSSTGKHAGRSTSGLAGLHLVATPIGNLQDITLRALETLRRVDLVACEDTRVTRLLLYRHDIRAKLCSYHDHNADDVRPGLIHNLRDGKAIALVCDAGTPLISDPGYKLVRDCLESGIAVHALPGPCSVPLAVSLSGLPCERFLFAGFLPRRNSARRQMLDQMWLVPACLVIFETARRLSVLLKELSERAPERVAAVVREMTKIHEEVQRGSLVHLSSHYSQATLKGEVVLVIAPLSPAQPADPVMVDQQIRQYVGLLPLRELASKVAATCHWSKRQVYARAVTLMSELPDAVTNGQDF